MYFKPYLLVIIVVLVFTCFIIFCFLYILCKIYNLESIFIEKITKFHKPAFDEYLKTLEVHKKKLRNEETDEVDNDKSGNGSKDKQKNNDLENEKEINNHIGNNNDHNIQEEHVKLNNNPASPVRSPHKSPKKVPISRSIKLSLI